MKNTKTIFTLLLVIMIISLCGCGRTTYRITSEPSGADVFYRNSQQPGVTPTVITYSNAKKQSVPFTVVKNGYDRQTKILGPKGGTEHFVLELAPETEQKIEPKRIITWIAIDANTELRNIVINESNLKDPFSAKFRKVKVAGVSNIIRHYCGYLNAKNSMGGYVGWSPFFIARYGENNTAIFIAKDKSDIGFTIIKNLCKDSGVFE